MVAHYRKAGGASVLGPDCNAIIGLAAASGYVPGAKLPAGRAQDMLECHACLQAATQICFLSAS